MNAQDIENYIKKRYSDKQFNVQSIATELSISESYLREIVYLTYNCCPQYLIETIRLEHAIKLLSDFRFPVYSICSKVGYMNLKTFRNVCKKRLKMTPTEFREYLINSRNMDEALKEMLTILKKYMSHS